MIERRLAEEFCDLVGGHGHGWADTNRDTE
jgi:hypothetical protein